MAQDAWRADLSTAMRERIARAIHEKYRRDQQGRKPASDPAMQPWERLAEHLKESNRRQAEHIPVKLRAIGRTMAPAKERPAITAFTPEEVELLAELEHERWVAERRAAGWTAGPRDPERKTTPYLVPWADLAEEIREYDREAVRGIPDFLAGAGLEIRRDSL
jgi:hypothetical protein